MLTLDTILAIVAPHECVGCSTEGNVLCSACALSIPNTPSICYACGKATTNNAPCNSHAMRRTPRHVYIHSDYEDVTKLAIKAYKFDGKRAGVKDIATAMQTILPYYQEPPLITYVPTLGSHIRERGFDHTQLLAKQLGKITRFPVAQTLIKLKSVSQKGANRVERKKQLKGAFMVINPEKVKDKNVLLLDDVITTGATIEECAAILYTAGALSVDVVAFARTLA